MLLFFLPLSMAPCCPFTYLLCKLALPAGEAVLEAAAAHIHMILPQFNQQNLALTLWSFAKLGWRPPLPVLDAACRCIATCWTLLQLAACLALGVLMHAQPCTLHSLLAGCSHPNMPATCLHQTSGMLLQACHDVAGQQQPAEPVQLGVVPGDHAVCSPHFAASGARPVVAQPSSTARLTSNIALLWPGCSQSCALS